MNQETNLVILMQAITIIVLPNHGYRSTIKVKEVLYNGMPIIIEHPPLLARFNNSIRAVSLLSIRKKPTAIIYKML